MLTLADAFVDCGNPARPPSCLAFVHTFPIIARAAIGAMNANSMADQIPMHVKFSHGEAYSAEKR
jgi:hypothetical protein